MYFKNYTLAQLADYLNSSEFANGKTIAITPLRAASQLKNPKASGSDIVLNIAFDENNEIIGYIGALPHKVNDIKCAWNSCWWVKPGTPAQISMKLLFMFIDNWGKKVLFSEMTPHTSKIIEKLGFCKNLTTFGFRGYFRFPLAEVLPQKKPFLKPIAPLLVLADKTLNFGLNLRDVLIRDKCSLSIEKTDLLNNADDLFISKFDMHSPGKRNSNDFNWISQNPWLIEPENAQPRISNRYYFSYQTQRFETAWLRFFDKQKQVGLVAYSIRNNSLKLPYVYCEKEYAYEISNYFLTLLKTDKRITSLTTFHNALTEAFKQQHCFLYKLTIPKYSAISKQLLSECKIDSPIFQMGDGDAIFT